MVMIRRFTCEHHDEYGIDGWQPVWLKSLGFDPATGGAVAHDVLEHMLDKIGGAEGEFMAFGASCWIRGESGWFAQNTPFCSVVSLFAYEFPEILHKITCGDQTLKDPGRVYKLRDWDYWNDRIDEIVQKGFAQVLNNPHEYDYVCLSDLPFSLEEAKRRVVGWMRKGFRAAIKRYNGRYNLDACDVSRIYDKIKKVVEEQSKGMEMGMKLTLKIDWRGRDVSGYTTYPRY